MLAAAGTPEVLIALIAGLPGIIGALAALKANARAKDVQRSIETPSGTAIGKQIEQTHHTALGNNYRLQAMGDGLQVPMPDNAAREEAHVEALNTVRTDAERETDG